MGETRIIFGMLVFAGLFLVSACKKEGFTPKIFTNVATHSEVSVTNAAPGSAGMFVLLDNQQVSLADSLYYGFTSFNLISDSSHPNFTITDTTPYVTISAGYHQLGLVQAGSSSYLVNLSNYFGSGSKYSVFVIDTLQHGQLKSVLYEDKYNTPDDSSKSQIRFLNLSPDAPSMDVWAYPNAGLDGYKLFANQSFPLYSYGNILNSQAFTTIKAGPYYFIATEAGTNNVLLEGGLILPGKSVITIYAKGLLSVTTGDRKLDVGIIRYIPKTF